IVHVISPHLQKMRIRMSLGRPPPCLVSRCVSWQWYGSVERMASTMLCSKYVVDAPADRDMFGNDGTDCEWLIFHEPGTGRWPRLRLYNRSQIHKSFHLGAPSCPPPNRV